MRTKKSLALSAQARPARLDFGLQRGVTIAGTIVEEGAHGELSVDSHWSGTAHLEGWVAPASGVVGGSRHKNAESSVAGDRAAYYPGEGDDQACEIIFPSIDGEFLVTGLAPGQTIVDLRPGPPDRRVVRVMYRGKDVTQSGIATKAGQKIKNVQIVLGRPKEPRAPARSAAHDS